MLRLALRGPGSYRTLEAQRREKLRHAFDEQRHAVGVVPPRRRENKVFVGLHAHCLQTHCEGAKSQIPDLKVRASAGVPASLRQSQSWCRWPSRPTSRASSMYEPISHMSMPRTPHSPAKQGRARIRLMSRMSASPQAPFRASTLARRRHAPINVVPWTAISESGGSLQLASQEKRDDHEHSESFQSVDDHLVFPSCRSLASHHRLQAHVQCQACAMIAI